MLKIDTRGAIAKLRKQEAKYKMGVTNRFRRLIYDILKDVSEHTPQWSGNLASNWVVEVGSAWQGFGGYDQFMFYGHVDRGDEVQAGHPSAVAISLARGKEKIEDIRWNSRVTIANHTPYAALVEQGEGPNGLKIREENRFSIPFANSHRIAMSEYAKAKYSSLGFLKV